MPEIAEVARIVHFLRADLVGKTIKKVTAVEDSNVFGKVGTTHSEFMTALTGKKVVSTGSQGKYFWLVLDKPPHPVMHFGMTGWVHIKGRKTAYTNYYKKLKAGEEDVWPPKYWKFRLETEGNPKIDVAFTDPRRFGRIRLVDCPGKEIREHSPLVENGPDPVVDTGIFTEEFLLEKMRSKHVPIKALLLDQANISGIGNWVADETLYNARLHPEQYCDDFNDEQVKQLYKSIRYVCQTAVDKLGDSDEFPEDWLFNYRWGKGSKDAHSTLPNGERLAFLTVGGRTSCYAPDLQKKTGRVVAGLKQEEIQSADEKPKKAKAKTKAKKEPVESIKVSDLPAKKRKRDYENPEVEDGDNCKSKGNPKKAATKPVKESVGTGSRRSARLRQS